MWPPTISIVQQSYNPPNFRMKSIWTSYWSTSLRLSTKLRVSTANRNKRFQSRLSSFTCINSSGIGTMSICQDNFIITTHPYQITGLYPLARNLPPRYQTSEPASWSRQRDSQALWLWQRQASCSRGAKCVVHLLQILQVTSGNECDNICWRLTSYIAGLLSWYSAPLTTPPTLTCGQLDVCLLVMYTGHMRRGLVTNVLTFLQSWCWVSQFFPETAGWTSW